MDLKPPKRPRVGLLVGGDRVTDHGLQLGWRLEGATDAVKLFDQEAFQFELMHITPGFLRQSRRYDFAACDLLVNQVTDPDLNGKTLEVIDRLNLQRVAPLINPPRGIFLTTREGNVRLLAGIDGLEVPKVLRIRNPTPQRLRAQLGDGRIRFPVIIRETGTQSGRIFGLFATLDDVVLPPLSSKHEVFVTEYVELADAEGLYRKSRLFFIGDEIIPRQHIISDEWKIGGASTRRIMPSRPDLVEESRVLITGGYEGLQPATRQVLQDVRARVPLDYYGLDCHIRPDGTLVLFELNATMNFWGFHSGVAAHNRLTIEPAQRAWKKLMNAKIAGARAAASA